MNAARCMVMQPGPRDDLVTQRIAALLAGLDRDRVDCAALDAAEAPSRLSRHLAAVFERALRDAGDDPVAQVALVNDLITARAAEMDRRNEVIQLPPEVLEGVRRPPERFGDTPQVIPAP